MKFSEYLNDIKNIGDNTNIENVNIENDLNEKAEPPVSKELFKIIGKLLAKYKFEYIPFKCVAHPDKIDFVLIGTVCSIHYHIKGRRPDDLWIEGDEFDINNILRLYNYNCIDPSETQHQLERLAKEMEVVGDIRDEMETVLTDFFKE